VRKPVVNRKAGGAAARREKPSRRPKGGPSVNLAPHSLRAPEKDSSRGESDSMAHARRRFADQEPCVL